MADYVTRMIEGLARALARVAAGRKAGRLSEAQAELAALALQVAGVDMGLLDSIGARPIAAQLTDRRQLDALAQLCDERGALEADRGDEAAAARWREHARVFRGGEGAPT
jgi:hypothetical protein